MRDSFETLEGRTLLAAAPSVYQAESAALQGGVTIDHDHKNYTGTGFANLPVSNGSVTWTVSASTADTYRLGFRYALGATASRTVQVAVNGVVLPSAVTFTSTRSWDSWATLSISSALKAGSNTVKLTATGQDSGNIDSLSIQPAVNGTITSSTISTNAYGAGDVNVCAVDLNTLWTDTKSNLQFAAFYDNGRNIFIGRRAVGSTSWQLFSTGVSVTATSIADDHDVVAIAVDGNGYLHMSWDMHNVALNYAVSAAPVTSASLSGITLVKQTAALAPTLFPIAGATTNSVTYPQFYTIPNSGNLLFTYRNGGGGGGSGNGNQFIDVYNTATKTWSNTMIIDGERTSVNGYLNNLVYDSKGNLLMSWTWRSTANWQTNSNMMFAQSPDNGQTWYRQGGTVKYASPIIQNTSNGGTADQVAQVIVSIPQNDSFINQTSMTVDNFDRPIIATYWTPNWNPATQTGNRNRQYMIAYFDGTAWKTSQVSQRVSDTSIDTSGSNVRDLGRPVVLVDKQNRVLVVTRSEDTAMGAYRNSTTLNNIVVFYSENLFTASTPTWNKLALDSTSMGAWEPTYDANLWRTQKTLSLLFEPAGLTGQTVGTVGVLDWNEAAAFAATIA